MVREACERLGIAILPGAPTTTRRASEIPGAPLLLYGREGRTRGRRSPWLGAAPHGTGREFARILSGNSARPDGRWSAGWRGGSTRRRTTAPSVGGDDGGGPRMRRGRGVPREHAELRDEILEQGTIFSEYPPGSLPLPHRFPERNRIVSGLSRGVIVAEAPERSGALITARLALEQGRDVMVVPGTLVCAHGRKQPPAAGGGDPGLLVADVHGVLGCPPLLPSAESRVGCFPFSRELHVGEIAQAVSVPVQELLPCLMEMELANLVEKRPGTTIRS